MPTADKKSLSKEREVFWQFMLSDNPSWDEKKRVLRDKIDRLPDFISTPKDLTTLLMTLSADKIGLIFNQPSMQAKLAEFFSDPASYDVIFEALRDSDHKPLVMKLAAKHFSPENAIRTIGAIRDEKEQGALLNALSPLCRQAIASSTYYLYRLSRETSSTVLLQPFIEKYLLASNLKDAGELDTILRSNPPRQNLLLPELIHRLYEEALEILLNRPFTPQEEQQYSFLAQLEENITGSSEFWPKKLQASSKIRHIGNTMGLRGEHHETNIMSVARKRARERFAALNPDGSRPLNLHSPQKTQENFLIGGTKKHGDYQGVSAGWEGHAFSIHVMREHDKIHLIYVNRGEETFERAPNNPDPSTVKVFTFDAKDEKKLKAISKELVTTLQTGQRENISRLLNERLGKPNTDLSSQLQKSYQKVQNCSFANLNISWHLTLVSDAMKANPRLGFEESYKQTLPHYKDMRDRDRVDSFIMLCDGGEGLYENPLNYKRALYMTMYKAFQKDLSNPDRHLTDAMIKGLSEKDPNALAQVFKRVIDPDFAKGYLLSRDVETYCIKKGSKVHPWNEVMKFWAQKIYVELEKKNALSLISDNDMLAFNAMRGAQVSTPATKLAVMNAKEMGNNQEELSTVDQFKQFKANIAKNDTGHNDASSEEKDQTTQTDVVKRGQAQIK